MLNFQIYQVAKDDNFKLSSVNLFNVCLNKIPNNTEKLTTIYNRIIEKHKDDNTDFLILMHADVYINVNSLIAHIERCKEQYDVMGLCGCSKMSVSQSPLNWWTGSNPFPEHKWGCVTHGELGNQTSFFNKHLPHVKDHAVSCIDGLCIILSKKAIQTGMRFDENFAFDFYDTDLSFQCIMKYKMKLGVLVEESLNHYSVGKSILTKDFLKHEIYFRKKWNLKIPVDSPIQQMINDIT